jgi:leucyl-tRNA synthetase
VTHELWQALGHEQALILERWWTPDAAALVQDTIEVSVQVNGKMRARVHLAADATQDAAVAAALAEANVQKYMEGKPLKFSKYISGRMVTIVV